MPARTGSKGIVDKNYRELAGVPPFFRAAMAGLTVGHVVITADREGSWQSLHGHGVTWLQRPDALAQDDTPMIDVVKHVLAEIPGPPDQPVLLIQPTQPLREPKHLQQALALLTRDVTSVVSVTPWPQEYAPEFMCHIMDEQLYGVDLIEEGFSCYGLASQPTRRQDAFAGWKRDGTVYAFWRDTLDEGGGYGLYGHAVKPLIIDPSETCALDTPADWREAERRLQERQR